MYIGEKLKEYLQKNYLLSEKIKKLKIKDIKDNSKDVKKGDAFLAIRGGNNYIQEAIKNGSSFIIYDNSDVRDIKIPSIKVENSIEFLQKFAKYYRDEVDPIVIGITGSNGKTTTKDILYSILSKKGKTVKTIGNYNNHIGLPLTILNLKENTEYLILEMGMSELGEIDQLSRISSPDYGIITNIGESHLKYLKTRDNIFKAKTEILNHLKKKVVINGDDSYLNKLDGLKVGFLNYNDIYINNMETDEKNRKTVYDIIIDGKLYEKLELNLIGKHNVLNSLFAIGISQELELDISKIKEGLKTVEISQMRNEVIKKGKTIYINDAYNASPTSVKCGLNLFSKIYNTRKKIIVLGDMLELGEYSNKLHCNLKDYIDKYKFDYVFLYGEKMKNLYKKYEEENVKWFEIKSDIKKEIKGISGEKAVFLKGSRGMALEKIIEE